MTDAKFLDRRVEKALDWDDFANGIPNLHIVKDLHGEDQDGLAINLDPRHKVAVHEFKDGTMKTVPALRSNEYQELAHDYVFDKIHNTLDEAALGHKVLNHSFTRSSGELFADIVLDRAYHMDEKGFEEEFGTEYTSDDTSLYGEYRPIIRVRSSFIRSSMFQMCFLRVVCSNGMTAIKVDSNISVPSTFNHVGKVLESFNKRVDKLINALFEKNLVENMMMNLKAESIQYEVLIAWMINYLGKQATRAAADQFNLDRVALEDFTNKWIAYNMATWAMSNVVESTNRRMRAQLALERLMNQ